MNANQLDRVRSRKPCSSNLRFEWLESRRLLSATPQLLKDLRPGIAASSPIEFVQVGSLAYFNAGDEIWKSDGTAEGTVLVKEIPATVGEFTYGYTPEKLANVNGTLFFRADDGSGGDALWKSDGTATGTIMVKDIRPDNYSANIFYLTDVNGTLFFTADDGVHGQELWKSDGTEAGTVLVKDIVPSVYGDGPWSPTNFNGTLIFSIDDGIVGREPWKSDGTEAGTVLLKDIRVGSLGSEPSDMTVVGATLFFSARDLTHSRELWKSDGTSASTVMVKDIGVGTNVSYAQNLINVNGTVFFAASDGTNGRELWRSDGTSGGTVLIKNIRPGSEGSFPKYLTAVNGVAFFIANDGTTGAELWKSDGTAAGTMLVKNITTHGSTFLKELTEVGDTLFFIADDPFHGLELWKSDGSEAGTILALDIWEGTLDSYPQFLTNGNGTLFFRANDGPHGIEPWVVRPEMEYSTVVGRAVFYNNSKWDGNGNNGGGIGASDDLAIATDKSAYLPSGVASSFTNMTSFNKGINGVMIDLAGPHAVTLSASDFIFRVGNNNTPNSWAAAPAPTAISIRAGAGTSGSDRVEIIWADGAIKNQWLEVIVKSGTNTGLSDLAGYPAGQGDVFFFGNKVGNVPGVPGGDSASFAVVGANDQLAARGNLGIGAQRSNLYDFDRNKVIDANDELIARGNGGNLRFINVANPPLVPEVGDAPEAPTASPAVVSDGSDGGGDAGVASALAATVVRANLGADGWGVRTQSAVATLRAPVGSSASDAARALAIVSYEQEVLFDTDSDEDADESSDELAF